MTQKDVEKRTHEVVAKIKGALHAGQIEDAVYAAIFDSVLGAYDESARMACTGCLNGWALELVGTDGQLRHKAYDCHFPCTAEGIHALKARLV